MEFLGEPFTIQNTTDGWLVTWRDAVKHGPEGEMHEIIGFTVKVPRGVKLSIAEVQMYALKRAEELLKLKIQRQREKNQ